MDVKYKPLTKSACDKSLNNNIICDDTTQIGTIAAATLPLITFLYCYLGKLICQSVQDSQEHQKKIEKVSSSLAILSENINNIEITLNRAMKKWGEAKRVFHDINQTSRDINHSLFFKDYRDRTLVDYNENDTIVLNN